MAASGLEALVALLTILGAREGLPRGGPPVGPALPPGPWVAHPDMGPVANYMAQRGGSMYTGGNNNPTNEMSLPSELGGVNSAQRSQAAGGGIWQFILRRLLLGDYNRVPFNPGGQGAGRSTIPVFPTDMNHPSRRN